MRFLVQCNLGSWVGQQFLVEGLKKDGWHNWLAMSYIRLEQVEPL
jgi:hypothetical protein